MLLVVRCIALIKKCGVWQGITAAWLFTGCVCGITTRPARNCWWSTNAVAAPVVLALLQRPRTSQRANSAHAVLLCLQCGSSCLLCCLTNVMHPHYSRRALPCCCRAEYAGQGSGGVPGEARAWFGGWMEKLERQVGKELRFYRLRSRLTELRNAYEFGSALGAAFDSGSGDSEDE